jgi:hypothetical protein
MTYKDKKSHRESQLSMVTHTIHKAHKHILTNPVPYQYSYPNIPISQVDYYPKDPQTPK